MESLAEDHDAGTKEAAWLPSVEFLWEILFSTSKKELTIYTTFIAVEVVYF